jgi:hypothetical protein
MVPTWQDFEHASSDEDRREVVSKWFRALIPRAQRAVLGVRAAETCVELVLGPRGFYLFDFGTVEALHDWTCPSSSATEVDGDDADQLSVTFITERDFREEAAQQDSIALSLGATLESYDQGNQFVVQMVASAAPHDYFEAFHVPFLAVEPAPPVASASVEPPPAAPSSQPAKKHRQL